MMGWGNMGWGGVGVGGMIGMVVFWLVLLALIVWAVSRLLPGRQGSSQPGPETPEEILDRRFARGEVDLETYQMQRAALATARGEGKR